MTKKQRILIGAFYMLVPFVTIFFVVSIASEMTFDVPAIHGYAICTTFLRENPI